MVIISPRTDGLERVMFSLLSVFLLELSSDNFFKLAYIAAIHKINHALTRY